MPYRTLFRLGWLVGPFSVLALFGVASCPNNPTTGDSLDAAEAPSLDLGPDMAKLSPAECVAQLSQCIQNENPAPHFFVDVSKRKEVDLLFVIDNSASMSPKQRALARAIPQFLQKIEATGASYHLGVVTSDVGTLPPGQTSWPGSVEVRCSTPRGDDGLLQNKPCSARILPADMNTEFALACKGSMGLCLDPSFVPRDLWISRDGSSVNVAPTSPGTLTPAQIAQRAFQCIGLVGDYGCGVEAPLESMKRALDGHLSENSGFLRPGSVLAVQFITDEDDCSVQLARRSELSPASMSCSPSDPDPAPGCYNLDYRCIARAVQCDESMVTPGLKHNCRERPGNFLEPVDTYAQFLQGLRPPSKLVVTGIWSPAVQDFQARGGTGDGRLEVESAVAGDNSTNLLNRGGKTKAACYDPDPTMMLTTSPQGFFGQAQLRLSTFIRKLDPSVGIERSICDAANYSASLDQVANKVTKALGVDCLSVRPLLHNGVTACQVGYVDVSKPLDPPTSLLPMCSSTCCQAWGQAATPNRADAGIQAACGGEPVDCYCAPVSATQCVGTAVAGLWRVGNADLPAGKTAAFRCVSSQ